MRKTTFLILCGLFALGGCKINWEPLKQFLFNNPAMSPAQHLPPTLLDPEKTPPLSEDKLAQAVPEKTFSTPRPTLDPASPAGIMAALPIAPTKPANRIFNREVNALFGDNPTADQQAIRVQINKFRINNTQTMRDVKELFGPEAEMELLLTMANHERTLLTLASRCASLAEYQKLERIAKQKVDAGTSAVLTKYSKNLRR